MSRRHPEFRPLLWALCALCAGFFSGCQSLNVITPIRTIIGGGETVIQGRMMGNHLVIETKWDRHETRRFIIDTGASISLVSPDLAKRHGTTPLETNNPRVRVQGANGEITELPPIALETLPLGGARFEGIRALVRDLSDLSNHLGVEIDGIIAFPVFRNVLLTLDYPNSRIIIAPRAKSPNAPADGVTVRFNNDRGTPMIPVTVGNEIIAALIDSGSDNALNLNPAGLNPSFSVAPRPGCVVASLTGDDRQMVGRLSASLLVGHYAVQQPIVEITDAFSSIGAAILRHFSITFDQRNNQVTFRRPAPAPIALASRKATGLSFSKTPAYWKVVALTPDSPAVSRGIETGDLCSRINSEPVERWDLNRYNDLIQSTDLITYTFVSGNTEKSVTVPVMILVP